MILYQMAKWMEERNMLNDSISQAGGDVTDLLSQREQLQNRMLSQAGEWNAGAAASPFLPDEAQEFIY